MVTRRSRCHLPVSPAGLRTLHRLYHSRRTFLRLGRFLRRQRVLCRRFSARVTRRVRGGRRLRTRRRTTRITDRTGDRFLTVVDRRLQAPLGSVLNLSAILDRRIVNSLGSGRLRCLSYVHRDNRRLLTLVDSVLSLSGMRTKRRRLILASITIIPLYRSYVTVIRPETVTGNLALSYRIRPKTRDYITSSHQLQRVLLGLLSGTIGFARVNRVSLAIRPRKTVLRFTMRSANVNVPSRHQSRLFRPFARLSDSLGHRCRNANLNLTLARRLTRLRNNCLAMRSRIRQNDQFLLCLPLTPHPDRTLSTSNCQASLRPEPSLTSPSTQIPK